MRVIRGFFAVIMTLALAGSSAWAQSAPATEPPCTMSNIEGCPAQVFNINNIIDSDDVYNNFILRLRNDLPHAKVSVISSFGHYAILVRGIPDDIAAAQKIITDIDHPKKNYRLTYTVTEMDGSKQIGTQHYAMIMTSGQQTSLKLGNKVPIVTESSSSPTQQTQFTYLDIGMNFVATLTEMGENAMLKSSVDDDSFAPQSTVIEGVKEPIVRQASLKGESLLKPGKPLMLGSVDIPGSTSHLDVEVVMEYLP
jgi:type II secretory pathway component GspD/PulD (secretin)